MDQRSWIGYEITCSALMDVDSNENQVTQQLKHKEKDVTLNPW